MSSLFSAPKVTMPAPSASSSTTAATAYTAAPARGDAQVAEAMTSERQRRAATSGRQSTLLAATSDSAQPSRQKTLLGE